MLVPDAPNQRWSLDFLSDALTDGRRFRVLAVVDDCSRECLALVADTSLSGLRVVRELDALIARRGRPTMVVSDNGTELTSMAVLSWCQRTGVDWHYIAPGKPMQNGFVEELQRATARRVLERDAVLVARRGPARDRVPAARLQSPPPSFRPRKHSAGRIRGAEGTGNARRVAPEINPRDSEWLEESRGSGQSIYTARRLSRRRSRVPGSPASSVSAPGVRPGPIEGKASFFLV